MSKIPRASNSRGVYLRALAWLWEWAPPYSSAYIRPGIQSWFRTMESDAEWLKTWRHTISGSSIHPSIHPTSTHLSNLLSIHSFTHPPNHSHIHPSTYPSTHWSTHLPICFCKLIFSMNPFIIFHSFFSFSLLPSSHFLPSSYALSSSSIHTHIFTLFVYLYVQINCFSFRQWNSSLITWHTHSPQSLCTCCSLYWISFHFQMFVLYSSVSVLGSVSSCGWLFWGCCICSPCLIAPDFLKIIFSPLLGITLMGQQTWRCLYVTHPRGRHMTQVRPCVSLLHCNSQGFGLE